MKPLKANLAKVRAGQSLWLRQDDNFTKARITSRGMGVGYRVTVALPGKNANDNSNCFTVVFAIPSEYQHKPMEWISKKSAEHDFYNRVPQEFKREALYGLSVKGEPISDADAKQGWSWPVTIETNYPATV